MTVAYRKPNHFHPFTSEDHGTSGVFSHGHFRKLKDYGIAKQN
jgi:hypothetical protein